MGIPGIQGDFNRYRGGANLGAALRHGPGHHIHRGHGKAKVNVNNVHVTTSAYDGCTNCSSLYGGSKSHKAAKLAELYL